MEPTSSNDLAREQLRAFQLWYAMGDGRTLTKVAALLKRKGSEVRSWHDRYGWKRRLAAMDSKVVALIDEKFADLYSEVKAVCQQGLFSLMGRALKDIDAGDLRIKDIKDLETVMKLDLLLKGEATERSESKKVIHTLKQDLSKMSVEELQNVLDAEEVKVMELEEELDVKAITGS